MSVPALLRRLRGRLPTRLQPVVSRRFLKFCTVGATGVVVNLAGLWLFMQVGVRSSFASAAAIEVSILSNFVVNELWTFRDQRGGGTVGGRVVRFQLVSLVGAAMQWGVFLLGNLAWLWLVDGAAAWGAWAGEDALGTLARRMVLSPPDVGVGAYVAQLIGIGVATGWNFLANFYWTWAERAEG